MTNLSQPEVDHRDLANKLAESYRREGYDVIIEPMPTDLPFELGRYRPDLLVRKEQGGFLIKVKSKADRLSLDELSSVADEVKKHDGWRFLLVTSQDVASEGLPGKDDQAASWDEISNRLDHARRLAETGDSEAAFLILWISLEKLLRIHARQAAIPVERLSPSIMIRQLYSLGELSIRQFDLALECQRTRDQLVHGFPAGDLSSSTHKLSALLSDLLSEWSASNTPT
jgi:hypothetical protein